MVKYYSIIGNFSDEMEFYHYRNYVNYVVSFGMDEEIQGEAERICSAWLGSSDFMTSSKTERMRDRGRVTEAMMFIVCSLYWRICYFEVLIIAIQYAYCQVTKSYLVQKIMNGRECW